MSEIIRCPRCQRRLRVPANGQTELVRCSSCEITFSLASASAAAPADPPPPSAGQRPARKSCLIVALLIGGVVLLLGAGTTVLVVIAWHVLQQASENSFARTAEEEEKRQEQLQQALKARKPPTDKEIAQQVQPLFDQMGVVLRTGLPAGITARFDLDRMLDEVAAVDATALPPLINAQERNAFLSRIAPNFVFGIDDLGKVFHWNATEIRKIKRLTNDEAVIVARHTNPNGASFRVRWWVTRRNGDWKIYDFENLDTAWRNSIELATFLGQAFGRATEIGPAIQKIGEANQAIASNDMDGAEKKLAQVRGVQLPPRFESLRRLVTGMVLLHRAKFADAVKAWDEAYRLFPDLPIANLLRGVALNRLGKSDQALKHLYAFRDLFGDDDQVCREIADALRAKGRRAEAAKEYQKALAFDPKDEELFAELASLLFQEDQDDQLQKLLDARAKTFPDSLEAARFRYRLLIRRDKLAEGLALFKSVLAKTKDQKKRAALASEFLWDMLAASKLLPGVRSGRGVRGAAEHRRDGEMGQRVKFPEPKDDKEASEK